MNVLEKCVDAVEDIFTYIARYMVGKDFAGYCDLATAIGLTDEDLKRHPGQQDPNIIVSKSNSLLTVFDVQGSYEILSNEDFYAMVENLRIKLNGYMSRYGHSLTIAFERDPDRSRDELMRLVEPQITTARRIGLDSRDIILDRVNRNSPLVAWEQCLLIVYTHTSIMDKDERKREIHGRIQEAIDHKLPRTMYGQNPAQFLQAMKYRHDTMVDRLKHDLEHCGIAGHSGIMLTPISAHEAIKRICIMVDRERTSNDFRAILPGDRFIPHGREDKRDCSDLVPPLISYQICSNDIVAEDGMIKTTDLYHGNISVELGPQNIQSFATLFSLVPREIPWRIRFDLSPSGLTEMRLRQLSMAFVGILPSNKSIRQSFLDLEKLDKSDAVCSLKITASTWSSDPRETKRRTSALVKSIQAWGTCQVTSMHSNGDPIAAWTSTIPGFTTRNVANRLVPPLSDALRMMPLQRPATPWSTGGSMIIRTPDGKIYPIQLGSRLQDTWIELITSPPGSGKSVWMNSMNFATIHRPGGSKLPLMTIIDVGPSSWGLIELLKQSLPADRQNEALYLRLQNSTKYAVNPFDTQLGARFPTLKEADFLKDFMLLFCSDPAKRAAPAACSQVVTELIKIAYNDRSERSPHLYEPNVDDAVDEALEKSGLKQHHDEEWWASATWWEVVDMLFTSGYVKEAGLAQRQAVPVLPDFSAYLNNESIRQMFGEVPLETGEPLLSYMNRCFTAAASNYAVFAGRTRFELSSETRVISIDLNDVIGSRTPEGALQTAIMYMFARQMAAKNYFLREEMILHVIPPQYTDYHLARVEDIAQEQKVIAYDEIHNTNGQEAFVNTMERDGREGRKWGIRIIAISHYLSDYPDKLLNSATSIFVMRGNNDADEEILRNKFKLRDEAITRLQRECSGPGPDGANFLALIRTKVGTIIQLLTNTVGPIEMWAFSTTQQDVALRNKLYKAIGAKDARQILAEKFPLGTAMETIEYMQSQTDESDEKSAVDKLAISMIREVSKRKGLIHAH